MYIYNKYRYTLYWQLNIYRIQYIYICIWWLGKHCAYFDHNLPLSIHWLRTYIFLQVSEWSLLLVHRLSQQDIRLSINWQSQNKDKENDIVLTDYMFDHLFVGVSDSSVASGDVYLNFNNATYRIKRNFGYRVWTIWDIGKSAQSARFSGFSRFSCIICRIFFWSRGLPRAHLCVGIEF